MGRIENPDLKRLRSERLWLAQYLFKYSEMALSFECMVAYAQKDLTQSDIVREAIYRQLCVFQSIVQPGFADNCCAERGLFTIRNSSAEATLVDLDRQPCVDPGTLLRVRLYLKSSS